MAGQQVQLPSNSLHANISNGGYATTNSAGQATFLVSDNQAETVEFTAADNTAPNVDPQNVDVTWTSPTH